MNSQGVRNYLHLQKELQQGTSGMWVHSDDEMNMCPSHQDAKTH